MPDLHTIRLHGPWQASVLECYLPEADFEFQRRVKIPSDWSDWLGTAFRGRIAYDRTFRLPTGLTTDQQVWLVVEEVDFVGNVSLNDHRLGMLNPGNSTLRIDIRSQLRKSNLLRVEVELPIEATRPERNELAGGLIGSVRLEIAESEPFEIRPNLENDIS